MMDPRALERTMHDLTRLIEEQGFQTEEEVEGSWAYGRALSTFLEHGNTRYARPPPGAKPPG